MSGIAGICETCRRRATPEEGGMFDYCLDCSKNLCPSCMAGFCAESATEKHSPSDPETHPVSLPAGSDRSKG